MQEQQSSGRDTLNTDQMDHTCMQALVHICIRAGKNESAGQTKREQAKRTKRERQRERGVVHVMELQVRVCRLIQSTSHYIRRAKA